MSKPLSSLSSLSSVPSGSLSSMASVRGPLQLAEGDLAGVVSAAKEPLAKPAFGSSRQGKPLRRRSLMMVVTQLSIMTKSGVDIADAIRSIAARAADPEVRDSLNSLYTSLEAGTPLSKALEAQGERYDGVVIASVAAGEASGRLPEVLTSLSSLIRDEIRTRGAIRSVLSYPIVLTLVTLGVLTAMVFFVLPQFRGIYENSPKATPFLTQLLLDAASGLRTYWWLVAAVVAAALVALVQAARSTSGRRFLDRLGFRVPLLRNVCQYLITGRLFRLQGVLIESGVPLLEVLGLTRRAFRNSEVRDLHDRMEQAVLVGNEVSSAMEGALCVPEGAAEMIATAEANGEMAGVLQTVGEFFESEGEQQLKEAVKVAEPVIIVVLGVVVGAMVMAVMLPMLDLSTAAGM